MLSNYHLSWKRVLFFLVVLFAAGAVVFLPLKAFATSLQSAQTPQPFYRLHAVVPIPAFHANACFDIAVVQRDSLYLADPTNASVDVVDGSQVHFIGRGLFQGTAGCHAFDFTQMGPNGVVIERGQVWAADGNATIKVFRLSSGKLLKTIHTGNPTGDKRADEMEYLPFLNQVVVANPDAPIPFLTYISADSLNIVARQLFPQATAGLEQPRAAHGLLYQAVGATKDFAGIQGNPGGEIDTIDPFDHTIVRRYATGTCGPNGLVISGFLAAMGCSNGPARIINLETGRITPIVGSGTVDMVSLDPVRGRFFFAAYAQQKLYVTDLHGTILQTIPTGPLAHSVAVDPISGNLFIPIGSLGGVAEYQLSAP